MGKRLTITSNLGKILSVPAKKLFRNKYKALESSPTLTVLMFHDIKPSLSQEDFANRLSVSTKNLEEIIKIFKKSYNIVTLSEARAIFAGKKSANNPKLLCLTFDDGFRSFRSEVLPLLEKYQVPASVAVVGSYPDHYPEFMLSGEITEIAKSPFVEIASHTYDLHRLVDDKPAIWTASSAEIRSDLAKNSAYIRKLTGKTPKNLILPFGEVSNLLLDSLDHSYDSVAITTPGVNTSEKDFTNLLRLPATPDVSPEELFDIAEGYRSLSLVKNLL